MNRWVGRAIEEAKKRKSSDPKHQSTIVSSPIRGANQDQSGYGVSHSTADYTISDEVVHPEGKEVVEVVAAVGPIRNTPVNIQSTPRAKKAPNAPRSAGRLQAASDQRRQQLDQFAQQQKDHQKQERERLQKQREASQQQRQQKARSMKEEISSEKVEKKMTESRITRLVDFISEEEKKKRGRPKKNADEPASERGLSLVAQFRDKKPDTSGHYSVSVDGKSHRVHVSHAQKFLASHGAARTADQKDAVERKFKTDLQGKK